MDEGDEEMRAPRASENTMIYKGLKAGPFVSR